MLLAHRTAWMIEGIRRKSIPAGSKVCKTSCTGRYIVQGGLYGLYTVRARFTLLSPTPGRVIEGNKQMQRRNRQSLHEKQPHEELKS